MSSVSILPPVGSIMGGDAVLLDLISDIHRWQRRARTEWVISPTVSIYDFGEATVLVNLDHHHSTMPSYSSFVSTWNGNSVFENPFEFRWVDYDMYNSLDVMYIEFVLNVLKEQVILWGSYQRTLENLAFGHFCTFVDRLKGLYDYTVYSVEKKRMFI